MSIVKLSIPRKLYIVAAIAVTILLLSGLKNKNRINILFIVVDDLRPELGCYGNQQIISPILKVGENGSHKMKLKANLDFNFPTRAWDANGNNIWPGTHVPL